MAAVLGLALLGSSASVAQTPPPPVVPRSSPTASPSPTPYPAETGDQLVVALDGSGDFPSITAAVEAATEGDTVVIEPGTYEEHVLVDTDIVVRGRDRALVTIRPPAGSPACDPSTIDGCALALVETDAIVTGVTLEPDLASGGPTAVLVSGGAPYLDRPIVHGDVVLTEGTTAYLWDGVVSGEVLVSGAGTEPLVEGNEMGTVGIEAGASPTITRNLIAGVRIIDAGGLVDRNVIRGSGGRATGPEGVGIRVRRAHGDLEIRGNLIKNHRVGLSVVDGSSMVIVSNHFELDRLALRMDAAGAARLWGNDVCGVGRKVRVARGPLPRDLEEFCHAGG